MRAVRRVLAGAGYTEVRIEVDDDDDADLRMNVDDAAAASGLLPEFVVLGRSVYQHTGLGDASEYPFMLHADDDSLLGSRVVWARDTSHAHLGLGVACVMEALEQVMATQKQGVEALFGQDDDGVLTVGVGINHDDFASP